MRHHLAALILAGAFAVSPGMGQAANSQQDRIKDCNAQAADMRIGAADVHVVLPQRHAPELHAGQE